MTTKLTLEVSVRPERAPSADPKSPCSGVCRLIEWAGALYCAGCWRSQAEIGGWAAASPAEKRQTLENAAKRRIWVSVLGS